MWTKIYREPFWMGFSKEQYEQVKGPMHYLERLEKISSGKGISISYGIAGGTGKDQAEAVAEEADRKMYENKREYYLRSGKERRKR